MKAKRIISTLLAVLMLMGAFTLVSAGDTSETNQSGHVTLPAGQSWKTSNIKPTIDYFTGENSIKEEKPDENGVPQWTGNYIAGGEKIITSPESKLATMDKRFVKDGYELYVDAYSGEVATKCLKTGEILFSNPYTIGDYDTKTEMSEAVKREVMSQIIVKYTDIATEESQYYNSYEWAASRGQIVVRNVKNGIRVEYTIGREEARLLVPHMIAKESFEAKILTVMGEAVGYDFATKKQTEGANANDVFNAKKLMAYYKLKDPNAPNTPDTLKESILKEFPITKKMPVYVLDTAASASEKAKIETLIKTYCPDYSYEDLDEDHMLVGYQAEDKNPPLFKMALEYSLDEDGMTVRLPANGIRFNESLYRLDDIQILPYMGAGTNPNEGYNFFPDGSGTLFEFDKIAESGIEMSLEGTLYGNDYAYHTITGKLEEILRYPVFGVVETENISMVEDEEPIYKDRGYVAVVEEGDALMRLSSYHMGAKGPYNSVIMTVSPRPKDSYNVADAISVGANDTWTVVSARKYTGNFKIRYFMLTDGDMAEAAGITNYYDASYAGMAQAYREYLEKTGVLTRLTDEQVREDVPLYIETFGAIFTTQKFLSVPVDVTVPLTSFDDIATMYDEFSVKGIENINFIMKGYTKGGLESEKVPYKLKWEKAVKGDRDFEDLLAYSDEKGFELFPDFDFVFFSRDAAFDGMRLKKHAVKTIDNRYTSKRDYSATKQTHVSYFDLAISPAYFNHFYEKLTDNYLKTGATAISVSTLGSYLNSDFDEDEPYNREDSKAFTTEAFAYLDSKYEKVMTEGGNAYTWRYVDYITDIALDSSRYAQSSASVPFLGMVLHGYVQYAGSAINMEGNIEYAMLKAIENGAGLKFILSYQNTDELKKYEVTSKYYSIRYDIWFEDVVALYSELNSVLAGVQTSVITNHEFLDGVRVPDDDEILRDTENALNAAIEQEKIKDENAKQAEIDTYRNARERIKLIADALKGMASIDSVNLANYNVQKNNVNDTMNNILAATTAADASGYLEGLYTYSADYLRYGTKLCEEYTLAKDVYLEYIRNDVTLTDARKQELIDHFNNNVTGNEICANNSAETLKTEFIARYTLVYDKLVELGVEVDTIDEMLKQIFVKAGIWVDESEAAPEFDSAVKTYESDENKIVYEVYESNKGKTELLLNFNNYSVMVSVNGVLYTVEAYGYIVLPKAN